MNRRSRSWPRRMQDSPDRGRHRPLSLRPGAHPSGLWVVDLSGRGIVVNGERLRLSPLPNGAELWIGRFLIGISPRPGGSISSGSSPRILPWADIADRSARNRPSSSLTHSESAEDEVPLGVAPGEPVVGLPSLAYHGRCLPHYGCNCGRGIESRARFRFRNVSQHRMGGEGKGSVSTRAERPGTTPTPPHSASAKMVASLLREMGELHGQMLTQFEQSLGLMVRSGVPGSRTTAGNANRARPHPGTESRTGATPDRTGQSGHYSDCPPAGTRTPPPVTGFPFARFDGLARLGGRTHRYPQNERQVRWRSLVGMLPAVERRA